MFHIKNYMVSKNASPEALKMGSVFRPQKCDFGRGKSRDSQNRGKNHGETA